MRIGTSIAACLVLAALALSGAARAQDAVTALAARLGGDATRTRLVIDLSAPVKPHIFALANPYRVVVDLPDVAFQAASPAESSRGLVSAYRYGLIAPGRSRLVMDVRRPVAVDKTFMVEAAEGEPARLVIELVPAGRQQFMQAIALQRSDVAEAPPRRTPRASGHTGDGRPVVVLDPGHGGVDIGAQGAGGQEEKAVVLDFARSLRAKLEQSGRYRVVMTRDDDTFVSLSDRVAIARENEAALFISLHADSLSDPFGVRGATIYTLSETASDAGAARLAEKENRADLIAGVDLTDEPNEVTSILLDLARHETKAFSARFAKILSSSIRGTVRLNKNPLRSAGFRVLRAYDVPSVLIEIGYMSNAKDLKLLLSEDWRDKATESVVAGIHGFFEHRVIAGTN